jgi:hypothetical protein
MNVVEAMAQKQRMVAYVCAHIQHRSALQTFSQVVQQSSFIGAF